MAQGLDPIAYDGRADAVRERCATDCLLITNLTNVRWLTGFTGSNGWAVLRPDGLVLGTDGRYRDRAADELAAAGVEADVVVGFTRQELHERMVDTLAGFDRVGAEANHLTHAAWTALAASVPLVPADGHVEAARRRKDAGEIARIARAASIASDALARVVPLLLDEPTETEVRDELDHVMRRLGAQGPSYDTIVAAGTQHAARPHHEPSRRRIVEGDTVVIDVGALVDGYHSDMTRSFVVGEPDSTQREVFDVVLASQLAGLAAISAGVASRDVDAACRRVCVEAGYGDWYLHSAGHGVGLLIHEDPFHAPTSSQELLEGDVVTVEPGLYRSGFGGFRVEDLVVVTATGSRNLTDSPKDSPCLPSPRTT